MSFWFIILNIENIRALVYRITIEKEASVYSVSSESDTYSLIDYRLMYTVREIRITIFNSYRGTLIPLRGYEFWELVFNWKWL